MKVQTGIWIALLGLTALAVGSQVLGQGPVPVCVPPPSGMVSWWPGDGNANDIFDGNNGTLMGGATFAPGLVDQAFSLNGSSAFVDLGNASNLQVSSSDFTVDAWVNFNSLLGGFPCLSSGCDMSIVDKITNTGTANSNGWRLFKQADNHFWFCLGGGDSVNGCAAGNSTTVRSTTVATTNTWFHLAGVKTSTAITIYVNGALEATTTLGSFSDTNSTDMLIGKNANEGAQLNGLVDEVELFNRALSVAEIVSIFNAGSAGKCKPFLSSGSFVIGDVNAAVGNTVTFWGAQWAKVNSLSGGPAPNAFKWFADQTSTAPPACGGTWITDPGNSSGPPATVPSFMAVIASDSISKSGPTISGDIRKIVIVKTDPGYGPAPGHTGTGTVVAVLCGN